MANQAFSEASDLMVGAGGLNFDPMYSDMHNIFFSFELLEFPKDI